MDRNRPSFVETSATVPASCHPPVRNRVQSNPGALNWAPTQTPEFQSNLSATERLSVFGASAPSNRAGNSTTISPEVHADIQHLHSLPQNCCLHTTYPPLRKWQSSWAIFGMHALHPLISCFMCLNSLDDSRIHTDILGAASTRESEVDVSVEAI